jgi:hypothetical protein
MPDCPSNTEVCGRLAMQRNEPAAPDRREHSAGGRGASGLQNHRRWFSLPCLALLLLVSGCLGGRPKVVAQAYVDALKAHRYGECSMMLTEEDRMARSPERFVNAIPLAPDVTIRWFALVLQDTSYQAGEASRDDPRMKVPIIVSTPDLARMERTVEAFVGADGEPVPAAKDILKNNDCPTIKYEDQVVLMKQHHRWRVYVNFPAREQAAGQRREALLSYYRFDFGGAVSHYQEALGILRKADSTGSRGLEFLYGRELAEIESIQTQSEASNAYIPNLSLSEVAMKMSAAHHPAIFGKITNRGKRSVDGVRMKVSFFEGIGSHRHQIFSEEHTSISTPLEFTGFAIRSLPLAAGETRSFGFELKAPAEIEEKNDPFVSVSGLVFTPPQLMPAAVRNAVAPDRTQPQEDE